MILVWLGNILIALGTLLVLTGLLGIYRFTDFFARILAASKVDTVGMITILLGAALRSQEFWFACKVLLVLVIAFLVNPVISSSVAGCAAEDLEIEEERYGG